MTVYDPDNPFVRIRNPETGDEAMVPQSAVQHIDGFVLANPADVAGDVAELTVHEVVADVGSDPVKAAAALQVEKSGRNRPTLTTQLDRIANQKEG